MIRDLQHHLQIDGRLYVIELYTPGSNPYPVRVDAFDVHIVADVPADFADNNVEPERIVRDIVGFVKPLVPASVTTNQWARFADVVMAWVCAYRETTP